MRCVRARLHYSCASFLVDLCDLMRRCRFVSMSLLILYNSGCHPRLSSWPLSPHSFHQRSSGCSVFAWCRHRRRHLPCPTLGIKVLKILMAATGVNINTMRACNKPCWIASAVTPACTNDWSNKQRAEMCRYLLKSCAGDVSPSHGRHRADWEVELALISTSVLGMSRTQSGKRKLSSKYWFSEKAKKQQ